MAATQGAKTKKGEQTRAQILDTALGMFREQGYEKTTMRAIARDAGVSLGNAYYYFESKEHLIQAFYARSHLEHLAACGEVLEEESELGNRLLGVMRAKLGTAMPYHRFSGILFKTAADPRSPLNPFSEESTPVRREAGALFSEVVHGSTTKIPAQLATRLPKLLWLYQMGIILYWIHDTSPGCDKSYRLTERSVELITRLIRLASNPLMRPVLKIVLRMLDDLEEEAAELTPGAADDATANGTEQLQ
jgi:AcrR family transcriptional regulator